MPKFEGSFVGQLLSVSYLVIPDTEKHEMSLVSAIGQHESEDPIWNGIRMTYYVFSDVADGKGTHEGYFTCEHDGDAGETSYGTLEATVKPSTDPSCVVVEGTWQLTGGNGRLTKARGNGRFRGRVRQASKEIELDWEGSYEL